MLELQDLNIESPNVIHGIRYQPTPTGAFRQMMNALDIPARDFVFVDFGCGKGRTLLLAADFGFKRVIGVEFSSDLAGVAAANARKARLERQVEVVCQDASEFEPPADKCVFYFFLPFVDPIMSKVVDNIKRSLARNPRQFRIVCYDPPKVGPFPKRGPRFSSHPTWATVHDLRSSRGKGGMFVNLHPLVTGIFPCLDGDCRGMAR